ncbi:type 4a pilus biogenesis protein PilO [Candidatus Microgenomates bacterium]|nr:type 4a pilus biogenesis protein PilO [Candidatus Microgenomates bacterium]
MPIIISKPQIKSYYAKLGPLLRDKRNSAYFMLILSLFALSFFGIFAIKPTLQTITQLQREITDNNLVYEKLKEKNRNLLTLQSEYKQIEQDLPVVYAALPEQVDAPTFLLKVRTLVNTHNLSVTNLSLGKSSLSGQENVDKKTTNSVTFNLSVSGSYQNIKQFLNELTSLDRLVTLNTIEITPNSSETGENKLSIQISGSIYTLFD